MTCDPLKILILHGGKIGDVVAATPLFRTLHQSLGKKVDLVAQKFAPDLLKGNDAVAKIYDLEVGPEVLGANHYTHALVLFPSLAMWRQCRSARIPKICGGVHPRMTWKEKFFSFLVTDKIWYDFKICAHEHYLNFARALGVNKLVESREIHFGEEDSQAARQFMESNSIQGKQIVGISVTAGKDFKEWGAENFTGLVRELQARGFYVVGVGTAQESTKLEALGSDVLSLGMFINAAGQLTLSQFAALVKSFFCFIAADTGPLYIADAMQVPVIDLMGPCSSGSQRPQGPDAILVGECQIPEHRKSYVMDSPSQHREEFARCMREITFTEVWQAFKKLCEKFGKNLKK